MGSTGEVETMTVKPICFSESSKTMTLRPLRIVRDDPGIKLTSASSTEALTQEVTSEKIMGLSGDTKNMTMKPVCFSEINRMNLRPLKIVRGDPEINLASTGSNEVLIQDVSSEKLMGSRREAEITIVKPAGFGEINTKLGLRPLRIRRNNSGKMTSSGSDEVLIQEASSFKNSVQENLKLKTSPFKLMNLNDMEPESCGTQITASDTLAQLYAKMCLPELPSSGPMSDLDAAALKLQKVYKSYRTRRNLADCAVAIEELWWKALDFASLKRCSVSFFNSEKPESPSSRWARARTRAAKVGKGLSKNEKAQKLALQHWLEAIDPRHRYGHNLHFYYAVWFRSESTQPFFYWLDIGDGKEVNLEKCPRTVLQYQCVIYLGQNERKAYEVIFEDGKLVYKLSRMLVSTTEGSKSIFVLSTSRAMYVGQKKKGRFQHSSFLAGGVTIAAGRLIVKEGILKAVWPYSGHYLPTQENFKEFTNFLLENDVDLTDVRTRSVHDDECPSDKKHGKHAGDFFENETDDSPRASSRGMFDMDNGTDETTFESLENASSKWTTGVGPRIGCLRDYPTDLQFMALEQFNVPATDEFPSTGTKAPIPLRRSGSELRLSPVLANLGFNSSAVSHTLPRPKRTVFVPKCSALSKLSGFEVATQ